MGTCQQKATIKWGITSEKMCVNICKGGEVDFDWGHNTLNDGATTHNVFAVSKKGFDTCKEDEYDLAEATYLGGWDDPTRENPNPGTADSNGNHHIQKNIQPMALLPCTSRAMWGTVSVATHFRKRALAVVALAASRPQSMSKRCASSANLLIIIRYTV